MLFQKTAIIGLGIIGGSLAGALKKYKVSEHVTGITRSDAYTHALKQDLIDSGYPLSEMKKGLQDADLVVLAVPIGIICTLIPKVMPAVKKGCIVTDIGSTKHVIMEVAQTFQSGDTNFVGGHPMAGSEKTGLLNSSPELFCDRAYALIQDGNTPKEVFDRMSRMVEAIGANRVVIDSVMHDKIVSSISHLPQLISTALMNLVGNESKLDERYFTMSGPALKDMTRIAESDFSVWEDIFVSNRKNIATQLQTYIDELKRLKLQLDKPELNDAFQAANTFRKEFIATQ